MRRPPENRVRGKGHEIARTIMGPMPGIDAKPKGWRACMKNDAPVRGGSCPPPSSTGWRSEPQTPGQAKLLRDLGYTPELIATWNRGESSNKISEGKAARQAQQAQRTKR